MRKIVAALVLGGLFATLSAAAAPTFVDLDALDAMQHLADARPDRYDIVRRILDDAKRLPATQVAGRLRTAYGAADVSFAPLLMVSFPPKRRLAFRLGEVSYAATVTVDLPVVGAVPADRPR